LTVRNLLDARELQPGQSRGSGVLEPLSYVSEKEREAIMDIREHMKIIGNDGAPVGTVDRVEGDRIKMTKKDNLPGHQDHHHFIDRELVDTVEGDVIKLSIEADAVPQYEEDGQVV
jgi:hypothetical protein